MSLGNLPREWVEAEIGNLIDDMVGGLSPKTIDYQESGIVALNKGDIKEYGTLKLKSSPNYLSKSFIGDKSNKIIDKGDVLVTLRDLSQKADFLGLIALYELEQPAVITQGMYRLILNKALNRKYLMWYSNSPLYRSQVKREKVGATQVHLRNEQFETLKFPLPPLAEQKIIADKLDTLLAQVESIKARLERISEILKQFRQSVLAAAVSGKLTEEWREKASNLKQVVIEGKYTIDENYSYLIPDGWCLTSIANTSSFQQGLQIAKNTRRNELEDGVLPILRTVNYENDFSEDVHYALVDNKSIIAEADDIILSRTGTVGRVLTGYRGIMHNNSFRLNYNNQLLKRDYLIYFLNSPGCQQFIVENSGRSSQPDLTHKAFSKCPISIPSLEEQEEIIRRIGIFFTSSIVIEKQVHSALDRVNNLTQSILAKAFRGELTAGWREANTDLISGENSAEELLERIKAERELAKPATKRGRGKV